MMSGSIEETIDAVVGRRVREELAAFERRILAVVKPQTPSEFLSFTAAGKVAGVHKETIRRWIDKGLLREYRPAGGYPRVRRDELERALAAKPEAARAALSAEQMADAILQRTKEEE